YYETFEEYLEASNDEKNNFVYTRGSNPTTVELEKMLAKLENGEKAKVFGSGKGAISATLLTLLKQGDHILMLNTIYDNTLAIGNYVDELGIEGTNVNDERED